MARHYCAESPIVQRKPTPEEIRAAYGKTVQTLCTGLLSCSCINLSLYSAAVGHHFARPGNRFWRSLHAGFHRDLLTPLEDRDLQSGYGMTNIVERARKGQMN